MSIILNCKNKTTKNTKYTNINNFIKTKKDKEKCHSECLKKISLTIEEKIPFTLYECYHSCNFKYKL